ncbi:hypothetical protein AMECASPLE_001181 [Ameca splendens]|uniref:Uncharacterized protein n=1 Tax=Ameca splendens TaxID=208324 RepID=A0ABV0YXK9_9TELE
MDLGLVSEHCRFTGRTGICRVNKFKVPVMNVCLPLELLKHFSLYVCVCKESDKTSVLSPDNTHTPTHPESPFYRCVFLPSSLLLCPLISIQSPVFSLNRV